ncbi:DUF6923 family protein [Bacillus cereus group sp. BfR-BA-01352]|uniref:DUF7507 domain-containing protein n=1 Tax=Bacillus cereus group sp. BfR-BA-01352 TaxID=2920315 RepID=UPI001F57F5F6|nr:SdrD B-like domain-containing protein [Bacillus cereus group sp. BfR-BA-01352]
MAATITGIVFNDLNHNGQFDPGEPGIPGVFVVLFSSTAGTCITAQTDANGNYSFTVTTAGSYTVYEPVANPDGTCPPTNFTQPDGFTMSNGPRKRTISVTATQINNGATIANQNFSHDTVNDPLGCTTTMIQFAGTPSTWFNINVVTGATVAQGTVNPALNINAIGYNTLDNFIYGYDQLTNNIVRVGNDGNVITLSPLPTGLPADNYNVGAFDLNGFFYISVNDIARFYVIDLRPNSSTFMKLVNPATGFTEQTSNFGIALSTTLNVSDWVYNPVDNFLYGISPTGVAERVSPTTGQITNLTTTPLNTGPFGAIALDSNGIIYAIANPTGNIYRYIISGNTATGALFSSTVTTSFNDATMCLLAEINVDFGDAPDTSAGNGPDNYSTLLANNGPRHGLVNELVLGTKVTAETDAYQNPTATGDDISKGIQDDGLTVPLETLSVSATSYSLNVTVTNETGSNANLYGWVDFNENGIFQGNEAAPVQVVPSVSGTQIVTLNFTVPTGVTLTPGHTFVRLRLTTDNLVNRNAGTPTSEDTRSLGPASDGEVEDYILQVNNVADLMVVKSNSLNPVLPGQQVVYTIQVTNNGPDAAQGVTLTDDIPAEILNPEFSLDGGITFQPWTGSLSLGTLLAGGIVQILIRGTVSGTAAGTIVNTATVSSPTFDPNLDNNSDTSFIPVGTAADISVVKTASPTPVVAGELFTYTLMVSNAGPNDAENVTLTDVIPSEVLNPQFSIDGGVTFNPWPGTLLLGTLVNGATETILIRGTVSTAAIGTITNTATVDSTTPDPDPTNNTSTVITPVNASADVAIVKTASPNPVSGGNLLTYTLLVSNFGPSDAENVIVTDDIPSDIINPEFSTDGGITFSPWPGTLSLGILVNGATETILIRGTVSTAAVGTITNTATVESTTPDPDPTNNTSTVVTTVNESADISVVKLGIPTPVIAGQVITYTIVVSNAGPSDAENVTLTDAIPSVVLNPEYSIDGGITFNPWLGSINLGTVLNGTSDTVLIRGTVSASAIGNISNTAVVNSTTPDPDPTNNTSTFDTPVETLADISVVKTGSPNPVLSGSILTYTVVVSNAGPSDAQNVTLADTVPREILNPEFSTDGGVTFNPWLGSINLGTLANGASRTIIIRGTVNGSATGLITNTAVVSSTTPDPDPTNNISTEFSAVNTSADISVVKTASPSPVLSGGLLTYTVMVSNAGPNNALNVTLTDTVPSDVLNPEFSTDGGITFNPWPGSINLGTLVNGTSQTIIIRGTVSLFATDLISNTATVASTTPDPDPDNNSSTVETPVNTDADISVVKTANPSPAIAGELLTYSVVVSNAGPNDALNVTLTDAIPSEVLNPEFSLDGGVTFNPWSGSTNLGTIANGASITVLIRGTVSASATGTLTNTATVDSTTPDSDPTNNTTTIDTPVNASADISVVKTGSPNPVNAGGVLTYTLVVSNLGPSDAEDVTLVDAVSRRISNPEFSTDGGVTFSPWTGSTGLGTLLNGSSVTVLVRGTVKSSVTGFVRNTAVVSSPTPDPNLTNNSSTIVTPVTESADISVVKMSRPNPVIAGEILSYRLVVSNAGPSDAQNVTLTDEIPGEILNPEFSVDGGNTFNPWQGSILLGTLASGTSVTVFIRGTVSSSALGIITNTATVASTTPDPNPTNNTSTIMTTVNTSADISVVKVGSTVPVAVGQVMTYVILISNLGPSDAGAVTVTDVVPSELSNVEFSIDGGITFKPWLGSTNIGDLPRGESSIILIRGTVNAAANGFITNTVTANSITPDPNPDNNTFTTVTPVSESADVSIIKTTNANTVPPGGLLTYTLFVSNAGPSSAQNVVVTDTIPSQLNNVEFSVDGGVTFSPWTGKLNLGTLASGAFVTIIIRGFVSLNAIGSIINTATVSSDTPDPNPDNNTSTTVTSISESADVSIIKTMNSNTVPPGGFLTYTLFVSNAGPSSAQNVVVTDTIPSQLNNVEFSVDGGIIFRPWTGKLNLGTLASGAFVTIIIRGFVRPNAIGFLINTATVSSDTPDPNPSNNTSTVITPIVPEEVRIKPCFPRHKCISRHDCIEHKHRKCE